MNERRDEVKQLPPGPDVDLAVFPSRAVGAGRFNWYRNHERPPWYFDSSDQGRFNLPTPRGTCYLASTPAASVRERIGPAMAKHRDVPADLVDGRVVSRLQLPFDVLAAVIPHKDAIHFGVISKELCTMTPYEVPRSWAAALAAAGFDGLVHELRFGAQGEYGLAVFGPAGSAAFPEDSDPVPLRAVVERLGFRILEQPTTAQLTVVTPPVDPAAPR